LPIRGKDRRKTGCCFRPQGPGACDACVNAKDGMYCVEECLPCKYRDEHGVCRRCHPNCGRETACTGSPHCTGSGPHLGFGGCTECAGLLLDHQEGIGSTECLSRTLVNCDKGFYFFGGAIAIPSNLSRGFEYTRVVSCSHLFSTKSIIVVGSG